MDRTTKVARVGRIVVSLAGRSGPAVAVGASVGQKTIVDYRVVLGQCCPPPVGVLITAVEFRGNGERLAVQHLSAQNSGSPCLARHSQEYVELVT